ncbi:MAG: hypothetical protein E7223_00225 [Clostridiales bacterium]|nr:hypothetical protein [Clostridiales bacterium]
MAGTKEHPYSDIIHLSRPVSTAHPPMSRQDRAAQFSPFAALTGHDAAVKETARLTDRRRELSEDDKALLNQKLALLQEALPQKPQVSVTYFEPDLRKEGGSYVEAAGTLQKLDLRRRLLLLEDGSFIPLDEILQLESDCFRCLE